jgi:hypothetical protein
MVTWANPQALPALALLVLVVASSFERISKLQGQTCALLSLVFNNLAEAKIVCTNCVS